VLTVTLRTARRTLDADVVHTGLHGTRRRQWHASHLRVTNRRCRTGVVFALCARSTFADTRAVGVGVALLAAVHARSKHARTALNRAGVQQTFLLRIARRDGVDGAVCFERIAVLRCSWCRTADCHQRVELDEKNNGK
jgi:hypothetical protein